MNGNVFVYFHRKKTNNEVFYVGIGVGFRPYRTSGRSELWGRIVDKYGLDVQVVHKKISWELAKYWERFYIKLFGRLDQRIGVLVNHTDGGDGTLGCIYNVGSKRSMESRLKISMALKGRKVDPAAVKNSVEAKRRNREERKKMGIVKPKRQISEVEMQRLKTLNVGRKRTEEYKRAKSEKMKGRLFSEETRKRISEAKKGCIVPEERRRKISETLKARNRIKQ